MPAPTPPLPTDLEGALLGNRYRIGGLIAAGGMAQVRRATDEVLGREVAVKILHSHLASDPLLVDRFKREAIAAARLAHPSIVSIYDTVEDRGVSAIVMELVTGMTLRQYLDRQQALPWKDAVDIVAGVADALQAAHEAGIVHRDVKPANILLCDDRRIKVADFGIAKATAGSDLTQTGVMIGTAKYLAPEQVRGERVDPRTDVYALGVVLYECLCGRAPFDADTDAATALARLHREPLRPRQVLPSVPRTLDAIAMQALARDPEQRFQTAAALRAALLAAGPDEGLAERADHTMIAPVAAAAAAAPESFARAERRWLVPAILVTLVGGALVLAALLIGRTEAGQQLIERARDVVRAGPGEPSEEPLPIASAAAFDPFAGDGENDTDAHLAVDGDVETAWATEFYSDRDVLGRKGGVGFVVVLESESRLSRIAISSPSNDWSAQVYVAPTPASDLSGWGEPVAVASRIPAGGTEIALDGARAGALLIWITDLGDAPSGQVRTVLGEVTVRGG